MVSQVSDASPSHILCLQTTVDGIPTLWVDRANIKAVLKFLRDKGQPRFEMLLDVTGIDERVRVHRAGQPASEFTVVYHLSSFSGHCDVRVKVPLMESDLKLPTAIDLWPSANWYEREVWDMYGIFFGARARALAPGREPPAHAHAHPLARALTLAAALAHADGHPDLRRLLTDYGFQGHPLRKDFPLTGFVECRYDPSKKRVVTEPLELTQEFRQFDALSPWTVKG